MVLFRQKRRCDGFLVLGSQSRSLVVQVPTDYTQAACFISENRRDKWHRSPGRLLCFVSLWPHATRKYISSRSLPASPMVYYTRASLQSRRAAAGGGGRYEHGAFVFRRPTRGLDSNGDPFGSRRAARARNAGGGATSHSHGAKRPALAAHAPDFLSASARPQRPASVCCRGSGGVDSTLATHPADGS